MGENSNAESSLLALVDVTATQQRAALEARDVAIRAAVDAGLSLRAVADAAGLSHAGVRKIVGRG